DYTGADKMRNVVSVTVINGPKGSKTVTKHSHDFAPPSQEGCPSCGDGVVAGAEQCDPPGSTCDAAGRLCAGDCTCPAPSCGDSIVAAAEQWDPPGSTCDAAGRLCAGDCTCPAPSCGDSIVDRPGEQCDPPTPRGTHSPDCASSFEFCSPDCECLPFD